jgi:hypothetical protein
MDGKFFPVRDGGWARLMDHNLNQGDLSEVHLTAVADQVRWQVVERLDPLGEFLLTGPIHLPQKWTSPLTHPRRTLQEIVDRHKLHLLHVERSSPLIPVAEPARQQVIGGFLRRLFRNSLTTVRTQPILPPIPTLEGFLTAQTGDGSGIWAGLLWLLIATWGPPTHGCPQG